MSATRKQIKLIEELQNRGAPIPCTDSGNPSNEMFDSVANADKYIKEHGHLMRSYRTNIRPDVWGGVLNT